MRYFYFEDFWRIDWLLSYIFFSRKTFVISVLKTALCLCHNFICPFLTYIRIRLSISFQLWPLARFFFTIWPLRHVFYSIFLSCFLLGFCSTYKIDLMCYIDISQTSFCWIMVLYIDKLRNQNGEQITIKGIFVFYVIWRMSMTLYFLQKIG